MQAKGARAGEPRSGAICKGQSTGEGPQAFPPRIIRRCPRRLAALALLLGLAVVTLPGCSSLGRGPLDDLYAARQAEITRTYLDGTVTASTKAERNAIISDLLLLIDQRYYRYEWTRVTAKNWGKFLGSTVNIGLSTAGTLSGAESTKTLMSALVTAIEGSGAALDRDVLMGQTIIAIAAEMRRARASRLEMIQKGMGASIEAYPLNAALVDLLNYYYAGTYITALQSLNESTAAAAKKASEAARDAQAERLKVTVSKIPDA